MGIICIVISGLSIGAWTSGSEQRANFFSETKEYRNSREKVGLYFGAIGVILLIIAALMWYL
nr:DUF5316 family protein [Rummeliibacillus suwonensis]